jgi:16S rRNA (uracil1498-N3)-methyltransferase
MMSAVMANIIAPLVSAMQLATKRREARTRGADETPAARASDMSAPFRGSPRLPFPAGYCNEARAEKHRFHPHGFLLLCPAGNRKSVPMDLPDSRARFYVPDLTEGAEVALLPTEAHHAAHVLRLAPGAAVELFDGRGRAAEARITAVRRGEVAAAVERVRGPQPRPAPRVRLAFAIPKGNRLDWLLEKAAELGVARLAPVRFARSVAGAGEFSAAQRTRWLGHCIAAAKQSGLAWLPEIEDPLPLADLLVQPQAGLFGDLAADALSVPQAVAQLRGGAAVGGLTVVVGPEGGLTGDERAALHAAGLLPVRLGRTTLRIETAAVALVAAAIAAWE